MKPSWGLIYWPAFIVAVLALFAGPELGALFTNPRNTLSDFAWYELGIGGRYDPHSWIWWVALIATLSVMGVLIGHIFFRAPN